MKNCSECKYCIFQDEGYSNYTVENTTFECAKKLHPDGTFDRFYKEEIKLQYAEQCTGYVEGKAIELDVDEETLKELEKEGGEQWLIYHYKDSGISLDSLLLKLAAQ